MYDRKCNFRFHFILINAIILLLISACVPPTITQPQPHKIIEIPSVPTLAIESLPVKSGLEVFLGSEQSAGPLKYGLLANQTCVNRDLTHGVELLRKQLNLQLILSPEHGLYGAENAGDKVGDEADISSEIESKTTYRKNPTEIAEMIEHLDVVLFDIQDIGIRSYTYIYSMAYLMQAAEIAGKKVIILDRPNPINGIQMEGNILDSNFSSFVGLYPIPYRHGMTIGELALLFNTEFEINCDLEVIKMEGWKRDMLFEETGLPWVPTSPHVPAARTILPMISTGTYGELGMLSEGVGTTSPFEYSGGPWITNPQEFADTLQARMGNEVIFRPTFFKPYYGRHKGEICGGVQIHVTDPDRYSAYLAGLQIMSAHMELYPDVDLFKNKNRWDMFAKVMGSDTIQKDLQIGKNPVEIQQLWLPDLEEFRLLREKYLLYN